MAPDRKQTNRIIFIPGKNPKPHPREHWRQLWRCLLEGVRRADPEIAREMEGYERGFTLISWNYSFYGRYKSLDVDLPYIDAVIEQAEPTEQDRRQARSWRRKTARILYNLGDLFPALISLLPDPVVKATIRETACYFHNHHGIADDVRESLKKQLRVMFQEKERIILIAHSMGSIIAYDSLWELWHGEGNPGRIDLFLTLGSPLGMQYVRRRLVGAHARANRKYPGNIRRWINVSAIGDLTALDPTVRDDFKEMEVSGLTEFIRDEYQEIYNYFRGAAGLNVHRSYGYLVNPRVGAAVARWWKEPRVVPPAG